MKLSVIQDHYSRESPLVEYSMNQVNIKKINICVYDMLAVACACGYHNRDLRFQFLKPL